MKKITAIIIAFLFALSLVSTNTIFAEEVTPTPESTEETEETEETELPEESPEVSPETEREEEVTSLRFERIEFEAAYQWSAVKEDSPVDLISELEIQAFDKDNNPVEVYIKDDGGLDLTMPGTYTITIGAINPENSEEETTSFELTINGEEIATPLISTCDASHTCVVTNWNDFIDSILEANANAPTPYTIVINGGTTIQADTSRTDAHVGASLFGITGANVTFKGTGTLKGLDTYGIPENGLMEINSGGTVTIDGITISDHYAANFNGTSSPVTNGQAITMVAGPNTNTLNLVSGTIQNCKGDGPGGAIEANGASVVNMYDGFSILNNETGLVQSGTAAAVNLYTDTGASPVTFNMYGGLIQGNKSTSTTSTGNVGAVRVATGTFNMYGGEISQNTAQDSFGAVAIQNAACYLYGGTIDHNKALAGNTGAIYVLGATSSILLDGTIISDNTAATYAGAVRLASIASAVMNDGSIKNNTAGTYTGGVFVYGTSFTMNGGTIEGNTATTNTGGVSVIPTSSTAGIFNMNGGTIQNNTAQTDFAGGVNIATGATMNMTGGTIQNNTAAQEGEGIMMSGTLNLSGTALIDSSNDVYLDGADHMVNVVATFTGATTANPVQLTPSDQTTISTTTTVHGNQVVNYYDSLEASKADVHNLFVPSYRTTGLNIIQDDVVGEPTNYLILGVRSYLEFVTNGGSSIPNIEVADGTAVTSSQKYNYSSTLSTRPGYTLVGWYEDASLTIPVSSTTLMVGPIMSVYAKWSKNPVPPSQPSTVGPWLVTYVDCSGNTVKVEWVGDGYNSTKPNSNYNDVNNVHFHYTAYPNSCDVKKYNVPNTGVKDNTLMYYVLGGIALLGAIILINKAKKKA